MIDYNHMKKFPSEIIDSLFTAVEEDDIVDSNINLPQLIDLHCSLEKIRDNYALCLQFWEDGFTRNELIYLIDAFITNPDLSTSVRMRYKYIRARFKHLRFAQRLYSKTHESGRLFHITTVMLGHFQDAFRNGNKANLKYYGFILHIFLSKPMWSLVRYSLRHIQLETEQGFITYRQEQMRVLRELIANPRLTGKQFHDVRKIISQQVSFYDTLRSIDADNAEAFQISRFLAAINGLMGDKHDEMVADKLSGKGSYDEPAALDVDIRQRLEVLLTSYPM
ncbi:hypothetical protein [Pantoea piersonii]|uniref:hypothetical protein n=1 Tax=Pantoea piersonii TaxID=2364647 RepID=UPI00289B2C26|nr:hypothetical protein [Pantoea piersonii]